MQLDARLVDVVQIEVGVAERMDEVARLEPAFPRDEMGEQRVARDIERHAEENIRRSLVKLAGKLAFHDIELEQAMAGRELHPLDFRHVPGGDDEPSRIRIAPDFLQHPADLVVGAALRTFPGAPLLAVDRAEVAVLVGPFVPDRDAMRLQIGDIGVAPKEPDQFPDDRFEMEFLRRDEGETLRSNRTAAAGRRATGPPCRSDPLYRAVVQRVAHEVEIGAHRAGSFDEPLGAVFLRLSPAPVDTPARLLHSLSAG